VVSRLDVAEQHEYGVVARAFGADQSDDLKSASRRLKRCLKRSARRSVLPS